MSFHNTVNCRKAKSHPIAIILGGEKWFENLFQGIRIHAATAVTNSQLDIATRYTIGVISTIGFI